MSIMTSLNGPLDPGEVHWTDEGKDLLAEVRPWHEDRFTPEQIQEMTIEQEQDDYENPVR